MSVERERERERGRGQQLQPGDVGGPDTTPFAPCHTGCDFEREAGVVINAIRRLYAEVIETGIGRAGSASEVADGFGIHRKLGWQIARAAYDDDPFLAARFIPTPRAVRTWIDAARLKAINDDLLDEVERATLAFDQFIATHAADRAQLEIMLEACARAPDESSDERWRREAFNGNSYIWGVRVRTQIATAFMAPSAEKPGWFDFARLNALLGFVRTRPDVRWVVAQAVTIRSDGDTVSRPQRAPLVPSDAARMHGVPIIEQFCSPASPPIIRRQGAHDLIEDELQPGPVGQSGEIDLVMGEVLRAMAPMHGSRPGENALFGTGVRAPTELLLCDLFVHRDLFPGVERTMRIYSELFSPVARDERDALTVAGRVQHLGSGLGRLSTPEAPHYRKMSTFVFTTLGWNPEAFDLYRIRLAYPPMPASVMFQHPLPPPPASSRPPDPSP